VTLGDIHLIKDGDVLVVHLSGEIDMSNAEQIGTRILESTPNEAMGIVLDFAAVRYLDSAGIYVVFGMRDRLRARGQTLSIVIPPASPVHDALRLAGVNAETVETVEEGVRTVRSDEPAAF